jgi:hypothetical protein
VVKDFGGFSFLAGASAQRSPQQTADQVVFTFVMSQNLLRRIYFAGLSDFDLCSDLIF